jgi:hypothetical protein
MLPFIKNIKYRDIEVSFRERLEEVRAETEESGIEVSSSSEEREEVYRLAEISPSSAIVESWKEVKLAAREKANQLIKD